MNCVFCKIVNKEIPCMQIYEDADTFAFLSIKPIAPGHTLVIPKAHYTDIFSLPENQLHKIISLAQKTASVVKSAMQAEGINIGMNNGSAAGQEIFHVHFHIIP